MVMPGNIGGWIGLGIGVAIWVFVIASIVYAFWSEEWVKKDKKSGE